MYIRGFFVELCVKIKALHGKLCAPYRKCWVSGTHRKPTATAEGTAWTRLWRSVKAHWNNFSALKTNLADSPDQLLDVGICFCESHNWFNKWRFFILFVSPYRSHYKRTSSVKGWLHKYLLNCILNSTAGCPRSSGTLNLRLKKHATFVLIFTYKARLNLFWS